MSIKIYLDTNAIIAAVEGEDDELAGRLAQILTSDAAVCASSELTLAEALVGVWRPEKKLDWLATAYEQFFSRGEPLAVIPVERRILTRAARLRAQDLDLKLPDAIQFATALEAGCDLMLSNDRKLLRSAEKQGLSISSLKISDLDALLAQLSAAS